MGKPHVVMVPYPAQGHVIPLLELAHFLAKHHIRITFVNTENIHDIVTKSSSGDDDDRRIRYVAVPDGLESWERDVPGKVIETVWRDMPQKIEALVHELDQKEEDRVTCLVCDMYLGTIRDVAEKMGIQSAVFLAIPAAVLVSAFNIPKMIEDGIIHDDGTPLRNHAFQFAPTMPILTASDFVWHRVTSTVRKLIFDIMRRHNRSIQSADWIICNSTYDLEPGAFALAPQMVPVGPLLARSRPGNPAGHFWKQDSDSLEWLDQQPPCSVIYAAFGSTAMLSMNQFQELALGLEHTNRPFLWVVRTDTIPGVEKQEIPEGFLERVSRRGRIVGWAPQREILSPRSIACFVSHCGWNSTVESLSNGVPMLCWPYFSDQIIIQGYICDVWRAGLQLEHNPSGNITSGEIKKKIDLLLGDDAFKVTALEMKEMIESSAREGGSSFENLMNFISSIQEYV